MYHKMEGQLRAYFRAKRLQDKKREDKVKKILFNDSLTQSQKDARIKGIGVPCKKCKSGSLLRFSRRGTDLLISCDGGDSSCNKTISRGVYGMVDALAAEATERIKALELIIVKLRLEELHGLLAKDSAVQAFEEASTELGEQQRRLQKYEALYEERTQLPARRSKAAGLSLQLQSDVAVVREELRSWEANGEAADLRAAAERYGDSIEPVAKELRDTMYAAAFTAKIDGNVVLVEEPTTMEQLQVSLSP
jgi:hypothetical protein